MRDWVWSVGYKKPRSGKIRWVLTTMRDVTDASIQARAYAAKHGWAGSGVSGIRSFQDRGCMIIRNKSRYDAEEVKRLVRFGMRGYETKHLCVNVRNCGRGWGAGRFYPVVPRCGSIRSNAPRSSKHLITIRIGPEHKYPATNVYSDGLPYGGKGSPVLEYRDWREGLIALAAHEVHHLLQYQHGMPFKESNCELAASYALARWRERE